MQQHPPFMIIMDYGYAARTNLKTLTHCFTKYLSGAHNDGFLLNTLKTLFSLSRVLSVKRRYKIFIGSVMLGGT